MDLKIAAIQLKVTDNKESNLQNARQCVCKAAKKADIIILPEMFNCPYSIESFHNFAEEYPGKTTTMLSKTAKKLKKYIIGGSIPEMKDGSIFNTCFAFNREGKLIAKHRKIHLFDVDVKDGITFKESDILSPGDKITIIETEFSKIGVCICYDMRFPELIRKMVQKGAKAVIVPAAFNMTTGPAHWHIVTRARALDNQIYVVAVSPARNLDASYTAYGHSLVVDPWGKVIEEASTDQGIIYATIDLDYVDQIRQQLPLLKHMRTEIYKD